MTTRSPSWRRPSAEIVAWLEPPLLLAVYAADVDTARTIATAVMDAGG